MIMFGDSATTRGSNSIYIYFCCKSNSSKLRKAAKEVGSQRNKSYEYSFRVSTKVCQQFVFKTFLDKLIPSANLRGKHVPQ